MFRRVLFRHSRSLTRHPHRRLCLIVRETFSLHHLSCKALRRHHNTQTAGRRVLAVHYPRQLVDDAVRIGEQSDYDTRTGEQMTRYDYR